MDAKSKQLIINNLSLLKELSEKFRTYQVTNVDLERIVYFLTQFETFESINLAIKLLRNINFLNNEKITHLLWEAYNKLDKGLLENPVFSSLGGIQDSSAVICYQLLKQMFSDEGNALKSLTDVNSIGRKIISDKPTCIIFFDDNITSGTQLKDFFKELIDGSENPEMIQQKISQEEYEVLKSIPIRICYAIQLSETSNAVINQIRKDYGLDLEISCGKLDYDNYLKFGSNIMDTESEASLAQEIIMKISEELYKDKSWTRNVLYSRLLGYGNLGKLTVFYYNVPKSLIPVFWKYGVFNNRPWIPLFPETQEQKKIDEKQIELDFYRLEAVRNIINSSPLNRKPSVSFGFSTSEGLSNQIVLQVPSPYEVKLYVQSLLRTAPLEYENNSLGKSSIDIQAMMQNIYSNPEKLDESRYLNYKAAVDKYNIATSNFIEEVSNYVYASISRKKVGFEIKNSGNTSATHCTVKIDYSASDVLLGQFNALPKPAFDSKKPKIEDFNNRAGRIVPVMRNPLVALSGIIEKEIVPVDLTKNYRIKPFNKIYVGQNDVEHEIVTITRIDQEKSEVKLAFEIDYEEDPQTLNGELLIYYQEGLTLNDKIKEEIREMVLNFKQMLKPGRI